LVERQTRYVMLAKVAGKDTRTVRLEGGCSGSVGPDLGSLRRAVLDGIDIVPEQRSRRGFRLTSVCKSDVTQGTKPHEAFLAGDRRPKTKKPTRVAVLIDVDPIEEKRSARLGAIIAATRRMTFEQCAESYIDANKAGWKSDKHASQWTATLLKYAYPTIGALPVDAVEDVHVLKILQPIWNDKTETANRVRGRIEKVLDRAKALKLRTGENPARWTGHLDQLLPRRSQVAPVEHHAALPYADLPGFMADLRKLDSTSARALEFTILTAARTGDTIGATRSEIDRKEGIWTVPAARLKGKKGARMRDHVVPLSKRALEIIDDLTERGDYLFANDDGSPLSGMAMLECLRGLRSGLTVHGFRSAFKDWASEITAYSNELSELALAHTVSDKVEAAYRRGDMREKRRRMMADWAAFAANRAATSRSKVVPIRQKSRMR
jgi:integrase